MNAKQQQLVKDIAKLLARYSIRDWEPIIRLLQVGKSKTTELAAAIEELGRPRQKKRRSKTGTRTITALAKTKSKSRKKAKIAPSKRGTPAARLPKDAVAERKHADEHLEASTRTMLASRSTSELQELYFKAVGSKRIPVGRDSVIRALTEFLQNGSPEQRMLFMDLLQRRNYDATEDYRRWTAMISGLKKRP